MSPRFAQPNPDSTPSYTVAQQMRYWFTEERRLLIASVTGLTEDAAREPIEPEGWSVHDILAHRMFWEGREAEALAQHLLGKRVELLDFPLKRVDGTNAAAVDTLHGHGTDRVLRELKTTRAAVKELADKIPDAEFDDDENAARTVLGVAIEHDREHRQAIEQWRLERAAEALRESSQPSSSEKPS